MLRMGFLLALGGQLLKWTFPRIHHWRDLDWWTKYSWDQFGKLPRDSDVEYYARSTSQANQSKLAQFVDGITLGTKARPTNRSREDSNLAIVGYD